MTKINKDYIFDHNYHSHCKLCGHAEGSVSDYCDRAYQKGFKVWGISDHGPLLDEWKSRMLFSEFLDIYLPEIKANELKYKGKMKILKSLELEYFPKYESLYLDYLNKYHLDYLVLGQHAIITNNNTFDLFSKLTLEEVKEYKNEVVNALNTKLFKILAHPDLFMYSLTKNGLTWTSELDQISREIIEAAIKNDVYIEVNVNGARRGTIKNELGEDTWMYPYLNFFRIASQYKDAKFILGADCHKLDFVKDDKVNEVIEFCNKLNIKLEKEIIL